MEDFYNAKYWVGCTTESASQIYFDYDAMFQSASDHDYVAAFDEYGNWLSEAKVVMEDDCRLVVFEFDY